MGTCEVLEWDKWFTASSKSLEDFGTVGQPLEPPFPPTGRVCVRLGVTPENECSGAGGTLPTAEGEMSFYSQPLTSKVPGDGLFFG